MHQGKRTGGFLGGFVPNKHMDNSQLTGQHRNPHHTNPTDLGTWERKQALNLPPLEDPQPCWGRGRHNQDITDKSCQRLRRDFLWEKNMDKAREVFLDRCFKGLFCLISYCIADFPGPDRAWCSVPLEECHISQLTCSYSFLDL